MKIITKDLNFDIGPISRKELWRAVKKLKRRKSTGPDEVPIEILKEMNDKNIDEVLALLNSWWEKEKVRFR